MDCSIIIPKYAKPKHSKPTIKDLKRYLTINLREIKLKARRLTKTKCKVITMIRIRINQKFKIMI